MPWYYAGPEAKPVGPVTLDELRAARANGVISPETYVIEHTGQSVENLAWRKYKDVFPASPLPPVPSSILPAVPPPAIAAPSAPPAPPVPPVPPVYPVAQSHPLFPSAGAVPHQTPVFPPGARPDPYYTNNKGTNGWCGWGFGLGLLGFFLCFACVGLIPSLIALPLCLVGLFQVHKNRAQAGQGLAIAGLILSVAAIIVSLTMIIWLSVPIFRAHGLTVTEQTSNDSE
jgi:hypothetical protein